MNQTVLLTKEDGTIHTNNSPVSSCNQKYSLPAPEDFSDPEDYEESVLNYECDLLREKLSKKINLDIGV